MRTLGRVLLVEVVMLVGAALLMFGALVVQPSSAAVPVPAARIPAPGDGPPTPTSPTPPALVDRLSLIAAGKLRHSSGPTPLPTPTRFQHGGPTFTPSPYPHGGPSRTPTRTPTFTPSPYPHGGPTRTPTRTPTFTPSPTPTPPPACGLYWRRVDSTTFRNDYLQGVAAISSNDVWAVGYSYSSSIPRTFPLRWDGTSWDVPRTLALHWDGSSWNNVPAVNLDQSRFYAVAALSANNVWAVGSYNDSSPQSLIARWDGSAWAPVSSPDAGALYGISAVSASDIWAVGAGVTAANNGVLHWDGSAWSLVPLSSPYPLRGVAAVSANDAWAVGNTIYHWDGSAWTLTTTVPSGTLRAIDALSATDIWAVGTDNQGGALTMRWNGSIWGVIPAVSPGPATELHGVVAISTNDAWAVGCFDCDRVTSTPLIEHWVPFHWEVVPGSVFERMSVLHGVAAAAPLDVWAVGSYVNNSGLGQTLTERYNDPCADFTPTPTATPSPSPNNTATPTTMPVLTDTPAPTNTPVSTNTPVPTNTSVPTRTTPTRCPMTFTDVQPGDYFYEAVTYLYCRGVISGYADNTFRPYNYTTRGQLCKIIVLAEGWTIDPGGGPHFIDVPATHAFYPYIETAYNRQVISGYGDQTFRPGNSVTRGQLCKIVVLAEQWALYTPPRPTFIDVPVTHAFYQYVETAYDHYIISGYADDTFRPGNNATRGQICQIVYLAVTSP